jgi:hypothetical protein
VGANRVEPASGYLRPERLGCLLTPRRKRPPVSKPQKIVDLALSPAMILGRERIDASIDADVANKEFRALDKVRHLINVSPAETTCGSCHRCAPSLPSQRYLELGSQIRKRPSLILAVAHCTWDTTTKRTQCSVNDRLWRAP